MNKFNVGDKVVVKNWDEMITQYGARNDGVSCDGGFYPPMKYMCNESAVIIAINKKIIQLKFDNKEIKTGMWVLTEDMIKHQESNTSGVFTKDMLETGMRVEIADGSLYLVMKDCKTMYDGTDMVFANFNGDGYLCGSEYTDDLCDVDGEKDFDIVRVYTIDKFNVVYGDVLNKDVKELVYDRNAKPSAKKECECDVCKFGDKSSCIGETVDDLEDDDFGDELGVLLKILGLDTFDENGKEELSARCLQCDNLSVCHPEDIKEDDKVNDLLEGFDDLLESLGFAEVGADNKFAKLMMLALFSAAIENVA